MIACCQQLISVPGRGIFGARNGAKVKFESGPRVPETDQPLAMAVHNAVRNEAKSLSQLQRAAAVETEAVDDRLQTAGYLLTNAETWSSRVLPMLVMLRLLAIGIAKIVIGMQRDRPVCILIFGCAAALMAAVLMLVKPRRSHAGDRLLKALQAQHIHLKSNASTAGNSSRDIALCAALFGATALPGTLYDDLKRAWQMTTQGGGGGCTGCGGGGCGGGGCGGGCGGCGG